MHRAALLVVLLLIPPAAHAQTTLPIAEEVSWQPFRDSCRHLLAALDEAESPLPAEKTRQLRALLAEKPKDPAAAIREVQTLFDPYCLIGVSINPESRVKAARGPATIELRQGCPTLVLLKIHNEGGVTHPLRVGGPELLHGRERGAGRWLQADLVTEKSFAAELSGRRLEYRLLRLTPRASGKREATFQFDVGQGTQDLGFRAEVPILFVVRPSERGASAP